MCSEKLWTLIYEDEDWEVKLRVIALLQTLWRKLHVLQPWDALNLFFKLKGDTMLITAVSNRSMG
jgi:hypothetical protein